MNQRRAEERLSRCAASPATRLMMDGSAKELPTNGTLGLELPRSKGCERVMNTLGHLELRVSAMEA